jgi:hypothetical protein
MVGSDYQAQIPEGLRYYGDAMPYENEDKRLWNPDPIDEAEVAEYLQAVQDMQTDPQSTKTVASIPKGSHVRDDEQVVPIPFMRILEIINNCSWFHTLC